jgi:O-methyltransferase
MIRRGGFIDRFARGLHRRIVSSPNVCERASALTRFSEGDFSDEQFENYLYEEILKNMPKNDSYIIFSEPNYIAISLSKRLRKDNFRLGVISTTVIAALEANGVRHFGSLVEIAKTGAPVEIIVVNSPVSKVLHQVFGEVRRNATLDHVLFIFKVRSSETYPLLNEYDRFKDQGVDLFVTSQFDDGLLEDIYRYSLTNVDRKCDERDSYDIFQCLQHVECIEGDNIEFGSYQGHSGLLMAEFIKRKKLNKKLYLCDTFEKFPNESYGIDRPWSSTHLVDFSRVKALFEPYKFVSLIKGEFEKTVGEILSDKFSFVMIDCDSYRAIRFVANYVFPKLVRGGIMFFEDCGHAHCLGARMAVDEFLADKQDSVFSMFSFFSGVRIGVKLI